MKMVILKSTLYNKKGLPRGSIKNCLRGFCVLTCNNKHAYVNDSSLMLGASKIYLPIFSS